MRNAELQAAIVKGALTLLSRGVHQFTIGNCIELDARTCKAYLPFGVYDVIDIKVVTVAKECRGQGAFKQFLHTILQERDGAYAVRMLNLINPKFEDFFIRLGFRLIDKTDYILLYEDRARALDRLNEMLSNLDSEH